MRTEKAISYKNPAICKMVGTPNDKQDIFAEYRIGNNNFDFYLEQLEKEIENYEKIDPYSKEPMKQLNDKVNEFLIKHAGISYQEFKLKAQPDNFETDDYKLLPKRKNLRKRLFDYRAKMLIAALSDSENLGRDLESILSSLKNKTIPHIKNSADEPTFMAIVKILEK